MDRALVGYLHDPGALRIVEGAAEFDLALDLVDLPLLGLAVLAVIRMDFLMGLLGTLQLGRNPPSGPIDYNSPFPAQSSTICGPPPSQEPRPSLNRDVYLAALSR